MDAIPLWPLGLIMIALFSLVIEVGFQAGKRMATEKGLSKHPVEASVSTAMLGLLAFMLAFTFGAVVSRAKDSRVLAVNDGNLAMSLHRLADLLPEEPARSEFRGLIEEYLQIRSAAIVDQDTEELALALNRSRDIQDRLWEIIMSDEGSPPPSLVSNLLKFVENDTSRRATGLYNRLPPIIWYVLGGLMTLATGLLGLNSGLHGRRSRLVATVFIVSYSLVLLLIVDLDRPFRTIFKPLDANAEKALEDVPEQR